jgi:hypothetical protein
MVLRWALLVFLVRFSSEVVVSAEVLGFAEFRLVVLLVALVVLLLRLNYLLQILPLLLRRYSLAVPLSRW